MKEPDRFRIAVQDERARRRWAEKELAGETERAQIWRDRAEERTARIKLLEDRIASLSAEPKRSGLRSVLARGRRALRELGAGKSESRPDPQPEMRSVSAELTGEIETAHPSYPSYPTIRVAALGGGDLPFLGEFDVADLASDRDALYDSDFVFLTASRLASCDQGLLNDIETWTSAVARQPGVLWEDRPSGGDGTICGSSADLYLGASALGSDCTVFSPGLIATRYEPNASDELSQRSLVDTRLAYRTDAPQRRAGQLLEMLSIDVPGIGREVGALLVTNKPEFVIQAVSAILAQKHVSLSLVVGLHGSPDRFAGVRNHLERMLRDQPGQLLEFDQDLTLGECLNRAAQACSSPLLAKFDDDDWYGPHYLEDAVAALDCSQADLVGKACYFVEVEETGDVYLVRGPEEDYTNHVIGSSMVFRRRLWEDVPFPHRPSRVDSIFLRGVRAAGRRIYSTTRYEHGVRRRADGHTWVVDPAHFAARGTRVGDSFESVAIDVDDRLAGGDA